MSIKQPPSHDWDDQDKCRRCGDMDWYASATCTPKQQPAPAVQGECLGVGKCMDQGCPAHYAAALPCGEVLAHDSMY